MVEHSHAITNPRYFGLRGGIAPMKFYKIGGKCHFDPPFCTQCALFGVCAVERKQSTMILNPNNNVGTLPCNLQHRVF